MTYMALQSELADCRHAYTDMKARAEAAEAVLAQCRDELDDLMAQRDTAEAALAERDTPCVFVWAESEQAWEAQCDGWLFPVYYAGDWPRCPRCGHPIKVQP